MARTLVVRHAQTVWNAEGRWQGHADPPLSQLGTSQCVSAAEALRPEKFDLVVTSDLVRARRSGELLAAGWDWPVELAVEPMLRERDIGEWSALTTSEIKARWPEEFAAFTSDEGATSPGGEPLEDFDARTVTAMRRVAEIVVLSGRRRALVVTHGGVLRSLRRRSGLPHLPVGHLSGGWVDLEGEITLSSWVELCEPAGREPGQLSAGGQLLREPKTQLPREPVTGDAGGESHSAWL